MARMMTLESYNKQSRMLKTFYEQVRTRFILVMIGSRAGISIVGDRLICIDLIG